VVRFGEQYRQWNAAFDAGYAAALGKPLITLHPPEHDHALNTVMSADLLFEVNGPTADRLASSGPGAEAATRGWSWASGIEHSAVFSAHEW
jgi:hypothetical protein